MSPTERHGDDGPAPDEAAGEPDPERAPEARSSEELRAAAAALSSALGAADHDYARVAAVERLTELRAAGAVGEDDYKRERRRLMGDL